MKHAKEARRYGAVIIDFPYPGFGVERHYSTMSEVEILAMAEVIKPLFADDCMVFVWIANANILFGHRILDALGLRYSSMITWIKGGRIGRGSPLRSGTEHALLGLKGRPEVKFRGQPTWLWAPLQDSGHKPEELHVAIERLSNGPYLELFARRPRPGWDIWGGGIPASDISIPGYPVPGEVFDVADEAA